MSIRILLAAIFVSVAMPAFGWSTFKTDIDGNRKSCWATTSLERPFKGAFGIIGQGAIDGPPTLAIFLQVIGKVNFGQKEGQIPLSVKVDDDIWNLDAEHLPVDNEPRLVLVDPPVSLFSALRKGSSATFNAPGGVTDLVVSLVGSKKSIGEFEECLVGLIPTSDSSETTVAQTSRQNEWGTTAPSFSCKAAEVAVEEMICEDPELAALDSALAPFYARAKARAKDWQFASDNGVPAIDWFAKNAKEDLAWRNDVCEGRRDCVAAWFVKRLAMMRFFAESEEGFGDEGVDTVRQLANSDTLISVKMVTHKRNVLYDASEEFFQVLPDGDIQIVSHDPFIYRVDNQKSFWSQGGAFWFSSIRDSRHRIIEIPAPAGNAVCMSKSEFLEKSSIVAETLVLVPDEEICVQS